MGLSNAASASCSKLLFWSGGELLRINRKLLRLDRELAYAITERVWIVKEFQRAIEER